MRITAASLFLSLLLISCRLEPFTVPQVYLNSGDLKMNIQAEASAVSAFSISPDGRYLLTVDNGGTMTASDFGIVRMWDLVEGSQIFKRTNTLKLARAVAISPDGRYAVTGGETLIFERRGSAVKKEQEQYGLNVWDLATGTIIRKFAGFKGQGMYVCDIKFSRDGRYFLASSFKQIYVFDTEDWKAIRKFPVKRWCAAADFSPDGKNLLTGDGDGIFHLWDIATSKKFWSIQGHKSGVIGLDTTSIAFSPDGKSVITSSGLDDTVRVWDTASGKALKEFSGFKTVGHAIGTSGVNGLALSPDGTQVMILAKPLKTWDVRTGKELVDFSGAWKGELLYTGNALSGAYLPDGRRVMLNLSDSAVRMYNAATGEEMAMFVGFTDGEWLAITKEGYYNASEKGAQYLSVKAGETSYSVESFYDVFYRPDIVAAKLRGDDIKDLITITMKDAIKTPPPVVEISPVTTSPASPKAKVCYNVKSIGGGIGEVRLFHNGKLIESDGYYKEAAKTVTEKTQLAKLDSKAIYEDMRSVQIKEKTDISPVTTKTKGEAFNDCKEIDAISGENEISITAFNKDNTVQGYMQTAKFTSTVKQEDPHLYILSIGIDQYKDNTINLKYAVKDSKDIEERLLKQAETLYKPQNIHYELLTDDNATKTNITSKINELSNKIKPTDSFILFAAGHGILLQNQYYMLTSDYDGKVTENNLISSNEIVEFSKKIKSLSQLFIFDTCHAGGVDYIVSGLYDARMSVLAKKMGLHIYASASDKQSALDGYQGNGLFTYTLLDGLNNKKEADRNQDNNISLTELGEYSKQTTTDISKEIGHPQTPLIINFGKDNAVYELR